MKHFFSVLLVLAAVLSAEYNIGDTVNSSDNISWTISGPPGHSEVGKSSNIFEMVDIQRRPVVIFFGQSW